VPEVKKPLTFKKEQIGFRNQDKFTLASTPVRLDALSSYLLNYPDQSAADSLYIGFRDGFSLHFEGHLESHEANNLRSANQMPEIVREKIYKELRAGRLLGPFTSPPFKNFRISPLGLVPKKGQGEFRLIHHLSYPCGDSINDHINPELCSVQYTRFDEAVLMVQRLGKGALLAKADIKSAFRLIPVAIEDFHLLGFKFDGLYYFDKALPFGCSISCATFERFARFLEWVVRSSCYYGELEHYLDDFLFGGECNTDHCSRIMSCFFEKCTELGIPIAEDKTEGPVTVLVFLGLELDSELMQVRIPLDKVKQTIDQIIDLLKHLRSVTLKELQSLIGSLNFLCRAVKPGRPFCRRLINATCGVKSPHHHIRLNTGMRLDLKMWLVFLNEFNGVSVFNEPAFITNADALLFTDSSAAKGNGFGAFFQGSWICKPWPKEWHDRGYTKDITLLEYFPILVAIYVWGDRLRNKKVLFYCDNKSVVQVINTQTSKSADLMSLVRALTLKCLKLNLVLKAEHIPGTENNIADSLSRLQMDRFRSLASDADLNPAPFPDHLWKCFKLEPESF
jgi:hypothetical protein